uniref:Integrase zinc-binding domain-containing protein n=1 Tax=Trichobilharzia regenti TaxID=157069 RepID=A0AA85IW14_TRIRE|nr:unnamed protein product [Trichobilharzia regenti]
MLQGYDFQIKYKSTKDFGNVDVLSPLLSYNKPTKEDAVIAGVSVDEDVCHVLMMAINTLPVSADMVQRETQRDLTLQSVQQYLRCGWPSRIDCPDLKQFYQRRHSLSLVNDCIMFGERVVVPRSLQQKVISQLHFTHPGIGRMKSLARCYVYWPNIDRELEVMVRSCSRCARALKMPIKTALQPWPNPGKPWSRIHIDFAGPINGKQFLVVIDAYSKWPEVFIMQNTTVTITLNKLVQLFSRFGVPEIIVDWKSTNPVESWNCASVQSESRTIACQRLVNNAIII